MEAPPPPSNVQRGAFPFSRGLALRACMWYNIESLVDFTAKIDNN